MVDIIIADIVLLDQRAKYMSMVQLSGAFGFCSGVIIGAAALERVTWRWIFYINLPICIPTMLAIFIFLQQKFGPRDFIKSLKNFDFIGMAFFTESLISILYGVTGGGILYSWSSGNIVTSLVLRDVGITFTMVYEGFIALNPMISPRIFKDRTASLGYLTTWCQALVLWAYAYFITLYHSLLGSAVQSLSATAVVPFAAAAEGVAMSITKHFKWINVFAAAFMMTGFALMSQLDVDSNHASQVCFQIISAIGGGILFPGRSCAVQAPQKLVDVSIATALVSFFTSLGEAFVVAIGDAVFQNRWDMKLKKNTEEDLIPEEFIIGGKMAESIGKALDGFPQNVQDIYGHMMADAIGSLWVVVTVFAAIALMGCIISKDISLDSVGIASEDVGGVEHVKVNSEEDGSKGIQTPLEKV